MSDTVIKMGDQGLPAFETSGFVAIEPLAGNPPKESENHAVDPAICAAAELPCFSVVGIGANGLTLAKYDKSVQAIGITGAVVDKGITSGNVGVFKDGTWNLAALNFDASYDTEAKKLAAFAGAPTPTVIFVKKRLY